MVFVYYLNINSVSEEDFQFIKKKLPEIFLRRVSGEIIDKKESILGRYLLYKHLSISNTEVNKIVFKLHDLKKLYIEDQPSFNISHSKSYVILAICSNKRPIKIGIDIEKIRKIGNVNALLNYFTTEEQKILTNKLDINNQFLRLWTRKEAYYKALGTGIYKKNSLSVINCLNKKIKSVKQYWYFKTFFINQNYVYSCVTNKKVKFIIKHIRINSQENLL